MMYKYAVLVICAVVSADADTTSQPSLADFVGFSASLNETKNITNGETVKYPNVITNAGNNYDPNTGVFTAPITAHYLFHIHALSLTGFWFQLIHNETPKVSCQGTTPNAWAMGGNSVLLKMNARDRAFVKGVMYKSNVFGDSTQQYATFTGHMAGP